MRLEGRTAIVTGGAVNIGRHYSLALAAEGAQVMIADIRDGAALAEEIAGKYGRNSIANVQFDVSDEAQCKSVVAKTLERFGKIDILVCNAAVNPAFGPMSQLADEAFDKIMNSNVKSNLWLCNLAIPGMAAQGGGVVIIVSSIAGLRGNSVIGAYGISKAADFALARNLAVEWGPKNVRVNCIAPGLIKTDFAKALWENPDILKNRLAATPLRRIGMPEEMGGIAAFLASKAASFITGQVIVADGGVTIA